MKRHSWQLSLILFVGGLLGGPAFATATTTPCTCDVGDIQIDENGTDGCLRRRECIRYDAEGHALCTIEFVITDKDGVTTIHALKGIWGGWTEVCPKDDKSALESVVVDSY